jgi:hypothetical protein
MRARYSITPHKEIELRGTSLEWEALSVALSKDGSIVECESAASHPYQQTARRVRVERRNGQRVEFQISPEGEIVVQGDPEYLSVLAHNALALGSADRQGYHIHIESAGDDHYVGQQSIPVVLLLDSPSLG